MRYLSNLVIGLGLLVGMIVCFLGGLILMIVCALPVIPFIFGILLFGLYGIAIFALGFCLVWIATLFLSLLVTGSTRWLKHIRISNVEGKLDNGFDAIFVPFDWWADWIVEPVIDRVFSKAEYCRERLIKNGDFR